MKGKLDALGDSDADYLIQRVSDRLKPLFDKKPYCEDEKRAIYRYLFSRRPSRLPPSLRSRLINLYDPLADRSSQFPDGLRWCLNVYVGCKHSCTYCYVNGYSQAPMGQRPHPKVRFERHLTHDLQTLKALEVPPAPLHISNSTDPLQEHLEEENHHTLLALQKIAKHRNQFTSVVILTKNPKVLCAEPYLSIIGRPLMRPLTIQISCAFWDDNIRLFYEPRAPSVHSRLSAFTFLAEYGIDVELRIDPLFPSSKIGQTLRVHEPLSSYSIPEAQSQDDLGNLVHFAKKSGAKAVIAKPLKISISRNAQRCKELFTPIYRDAYPDKRGRALGGSWRLPDEYQKCLVSTVSHLCAEEGIRFKHCMHDVLTRD